MCEQKKCLKNLQTKTHQDQQQLNMPTFLYKNKQRENVSYFINKNAELNTLMAAPSAATSRDFLSVGSHVLFKINEQFFVRKYKTKKQVMQQKYAIY